MQIACCGTRIKPAPCLNSFTTLLSVEEVGVARVWGKKKLMST